MADLRPFMVVRQVGVMRLAAVAGGIIANWALGLWLIMLLRPGPAVFVSIQISAVLILVWIPLYVWLWKRFRLAFLPIFFLPNPFVGHIGLLMAACFSGHMCP